MNREVTETDLKLYRTAVSMLERSYSPFSGFRVGAALLTKSGEIVTGVNIENSSLGATICAERPRMNPHIPAMRQCLASVMGIDEDDVSVKATTTERLGYTGREEGISAYAVALIEKRG